MKKNLKSWMASLVVVILMGGLCLIPASGQRANESRRAGKTPAPARAKPVVVEQPANTSCVGGICVQLVRSFEEWLANLPPQNGVTNFRVVPVKSAETTLYAIISGNVVSIPVMDEAVFSEFIASPEDDTKDGVVAKALGIWCYPPAPDGTRSCITEISDPYSDGFCLITFDENHVATWGICFDY